MLKVLKASSKLKVQTKPTKTDYIRIIAINYSENTKWITQYIEILNIYKEFTLVRPTVARIYLMRVHYSEYSKKTSIIDYLFIKS